MRKKRFAALVLALCIISSASIASAYTDYSEVYVPDAIDSTTRWVSPTKNGAAYSYFTINSKWAEVRTTGTSPHVGVDTPVSKAYNVVAVTNGTLTRDKADTSYNTTSLSTSKSGVYCHYEHMLSADIMPNGQYKQGDKIGIPGTQGAPLHLHFGAYSANTLSGRKSYRNETLYRNSGANWDNGRYVDVFSQVLWLGNGTAQITASFSGSDNSHTEKPKEMRVFYRVAGTTNWIDGGLMTNTSGYNYTYNFTGKVASGTRIEWTVRITRNISKSDGKIYVFAPSKFYNPSPDPNATSNKYAAFTNTV